MYLYRQDRDMINEDRIESEGLDSGQLLTLKAFRAQDRVRMYGLTKQELYIEAS